jgi:8-oxo-dGTP pyrophosphatase MutT (NUDIX family)
VGDVIAIPDGHDAVLSQGNPSADETAGFVSMGLQVDHPHGRPLHPWLDDMVCRRDIGVLTGKGAYWNWGPNYTADPIVFRQSGATREVLLIQRGDTGAWALPGGFVEPGDTALQTAVKEAGEETGLDITSLAHDARLVYRGPLADLRATAHAWPETTAYLFDATGSDLPEPCGNDDAIDATWVPMAECSDLLFGSHSLLVGMAGALYARFR